MSEDIQSLQAERDRFKELWDGTRDTAERLRTALEYIAGGHSLNSVIYARRALEDIDSEAKS